MSDTAEENDRLLDVQNHSKSDSRLPAFCLWCAAKMGADQTGKDLLSLAFKEMEDGGEFSMLPVNKDEKSDDWKRNCMDISKLNKSVSMETEDESVTSGCVHVQDTNTKTDDTNALRSCPMCQIQFDEG